MATTSICKHTEFPVLEQIVARVCLFQMSTNEKNPRLRDPFFTSPLPRTYYHPSPARDVNIHVAIQGPEKSSQSWEKSELENPFETGPTLKFSALPQLKSMISSKTHLTDKSGDMDDFFSRSEQQSNSMLETTQLTSSVEEKERTAPLEYIFHQREDSQEQGTSISLIQKYIDRFRYSAPKSREEREKEKAKKRDTFWWLNSDAPRNQEVKKPLSSGKSDMPTSTGHLYQSANQEGGIKLTREAILELDKETTDLQQKADKLLSKSQLSLASSGPCVSTDGLGSSTALSECSYRTDPQPSYRPIFVNLQGHSEGYKREPVKSKDAFQTIQEELPLSPKDVLARWRRRRMMGEASQRHVRVPTTQKPTRNHSEIDIRLEEFRKKLFAQRTLVTSEDIQFERQKMRMIIDDDDEDQERNAKSNMSGELQKAKDLQYSCAKPQEDPILSRLRKITKENESLNSEDYRTTDHMVLSSSEQPISNNQKDGLIINSKRGLSFNSNNVNSAHDASDFSVDCFYGDQTTLNKNNTALSPRGIENQGKENYVIDNMPSMCVCDAKKRVFSLNSNSVSNSRSRAIKDSETNSKQSLKDSSQNLSNKKERKLRTVDNNNRNRSNEKGTSDTSFERSERTSSGTLKSSTDDKSQILKGAVNCDHHVKSPSISCEEGSIFSEDSASDQKNKYHQRLEAEKPCDQSYQPRKRQQRKDSQRNQQMRDNYNTSDGYESENSVLSKGSEKSCKSVNKSRQSASDNRNSKYSNDEDLSDASSQKSESLSKGNKSSRNDNVQVNAVNPVNQPSGGRETKSKRLDKERKDDATSIPSDLSVQKDPRTPHHADRIKITVPQSSHHNNVHKAIGEAVVDHLFDGPSMISSVDSWASLFPQSPSHSHSFYNSTVVTPTKDNLPSNGQVRSCTPSPTQRLPTVSPSQKIMTSTPQNYRTVNSPPLKDSDPAYPTDTDGNEDSCDDFESDPLMNLLLQQKKEYLQKLELIELKLQQFEAGSS